MSIYNSHSHGPIPLSMEGKRLMQSLRAAIGTAIASGAYVDDVAHARGALAKYMSTLEASAKRAQPVKECADTGPVNPAEIALRTGKWPDAKVRSYQMEMMERMRKDGQFVSYHSAGWPDWLGKPRYNWKLLENVIQGTRIDSIILDDLTHKQEKIDMSKKQSQRASVSRK